VLWLSGSAYDVVFDTARAAIAALEPVASVADESSSWPYRHDRDLTGFIDGSENPSLIDAPEFAVIHDGGPGAGGTILLFQKWLHDASAWESMPVAEQELAIGRTKDESVELDAKPDTSHVARTDQDRRRSARRADALHASAHRRVLLRSDDRSAGRFGAAPATVGD
jgi:porphyrinogen peroxidase